MDFVAVVSDEFSGRQLMGQDIIFRNQSEIVTPIYKKMEGYYVFHRLGMQKLELEVSKSGYLNKNITIEPGKLDRGNPLVHIRLDRRYSKFSPDCHWIWGQCAPNSVVRYIPQKEISMKLQGAENLPDSCILTIISDGRENLEGKRFIVADEEFVIMENVSPNTYKAGAPLKKEYKKGSDILRVFHSSSDNEGQFWLPVVAGKELNIKFVKYYNKEKKAWQDPVCATVLK